MDLVIVWTGHAACALQAALRLTNESFAEHLGIAVRTVAAWHQKPTLKPKSEMQQLLDTALDQPSPAVQARFSELLTGYADAAAEPRPVPVLPFQQTSARPNDGAAEVERRLYSDSHIHAALDWLDRSAGGAPGTSRQRVASRLARLNVGEIHDRSARRRQVNQHHIAQALGEYYGEQLDGYGRYTARYGDNNQTTTSVLTCPNWLDVACPLLSAQDQLMLADASASRDLVLDEQAVDHATRRLVETLALNTRLVDMPLYRLVGLDVCAGHVGGAVDVVSFVEYALTMDLLEGEGLFALLQGLRRLAQIGGRRVRLPTIDWQLLS
jgi:hypothetical protein